MSTSSIGRRRAGTALLGAVLALAAPVYAQPAARPATYNLPSLPLGDALLALGRQAGLEISFPPAAVAGKTAPALRANTAAARAGPPAGRIRPGPESGRSGPLHRLRGQDQSVSAHRLDAVRVYGEQPGERTYTREQITETPSSNRDLTSLVASHPRGARQCRRQRFAEPGLAGRGRPVLPRRQPLPEPVPAGRHGRHQPPGPGQQEPEPAGRQHPQQQPVVFRRHQPARGGSRLRQLRRRNTAASLAAWSTPGCAATPARTT